MSALYVDPIRSTEEGAYYVGRYMRAIGYGLGNADGVVADWFLDGNALHLTVRHDCGDPLPSLEDEAVWTAVCEGFCPVCGRYIGGWTEDGQPVAFPACGVCAGGQEPHDGHGVRP